MVDDNDGTPFTTEKIPSQDGLKPETARLLSQRLTLLHSERPKLYGVLAVLSAIRLP